MLEVANVTKYFGGLAAVRNVSFTIKEGELVGLIGPNGAGKTTIFNLISGIYRPTYGTIRFHGKEIIKLKPHEVRKLGIGRTFQIVRPFMSMSCLENVMVGFLFGKEKSTDMKRAQIESMRLLEFMGLSEKKDAPAKSLTLVEKKKLEVARALAAEPKILLLDEPISGLNPSETLRAMEIIRKIRDELGVTILWIEHVMRAVMGIAERIIVLHHGEKIAEGPPEEVANDEAVIEAYLGKKYTS